MREWTTRIPTFQPAQAATPSPTPPPRNYTVPNPTPVFTAPAMNQPTRPQPQAPKAPSWIQSQTQQMQPYKGPLTTTFIPRSQALKEKRNNPKGKGKKLAFDPVIDRSAIRPNAFGGGRNFTPTTGAGAYDTKGFGSGDINLRPPDPVAFNGVGYNPITNPSGTNAPSMDPNSFEWWMVNGGLDVPNVDRSGSYVSDAPEGGYGVDNPFQGYDYMGRPLGYGGQVIWDENGNVIPEVAAQYESMGIPIPDINGPEFSIDKHLGTGRPQLPAQPTTQGYLGGGRPTLPSYVPTGNLAAGNTGNSGPSGQRTPRGTALTSNSTVNLPYNVVRDIQKGQGKFKNLKNKDRGLYDSIVGSRGLGINAQDLFNKRPGLFELGKVKEEVIEKTLRYINDLGFDPLEVVQNPALFNMLYSNQFMY